MMYTDTTPENKGMHWVCGGCVFDQLDYLDVTTSLPLDVMHDLLEGVALLVLRLVVSKAHHKKHISKQVNGELRIISFGQNNRTNEPVLCQKIFYSVVGSASQKWRLFRLLPFLMAHRIPKGCNYWQIYLLCREIANRSRRVSLFLTE